MNVRAREAAKRSATIAVLLAAGGAASFAAFRTGGVALGALTAVFLALAVALALRVRPGSSDAELLEELFTAGLLALPAALILYFSFSAGGFFPGAPAFAALVLLVLLVLRTTLVDEPFPGFSWPLAVAAGALGSYALWTLASGLWSDAPARALIEAVRALVYLLALVLLGSIAHTPGRLRWMLRGVTAAVVAVALVALLTRVLPDVFPTAENLSNDRLSYPLTYWNTLGMLGGLGVIFCVALSSDLREPPAVRVLAAAALPVLGTTVFFTFSRAAILAALAGLVLFVVVARPRGLPNALLAAVPATVIAVTAAYGADLLATADPTTTAAVSQGREVALVVGFAALGAAVVRALLLVLDARIGAWEITGALRRELLGAATVVAAICVVAAAIQFDAPSRVADGYGRFVESTPVNTTDLRDRLRSASGNGRIEQWRAGMRLFEREPALGIGAGTFGLVWPRERPASNGLVVDDAHSLYVETLAELGVVGFALLVVALLTILAAVVPAGRGRDRPLYAAVFSGLAAWSVHAGVDWDWEMPALTVVVFALGGLALARPAGAPRPLTPGSGLRVAIGLAALLAATGPALVLVSENRLERSVEAFNRGDCGRAIDAATASLTVLDSRPEPYEVLGFCQARRGFASLGIQALARAAEHDPANWEYRYSLALVRGAGGVDPRRDARAALRLNPHDARTRTLVRLLRERRDWKPALAAMARREQLSVVR